MNEIKLMLLFVTLLYTQYSKQIILNSIRPICVGLAIQKSISLILSIIVALTLNHFFLHYSKFMNGKEEFLRFIYKKIWLFSLYRNLNRNGTLLNFCLFSLIDLSYFLLFYHILVFKLFPGIENSIIPDYCYG